MFGRKNSSADSSIKNHIIPTTNSKALNTIVNSTTVEGNIKSGNDIRIDGDLIGNLHCEAKVIIGPHGKVIGEIHCVNAVIEGQFEGILNVKESLTLAATANVKGDIKTNKMAVITGATFNGECKMGNASAPNNNGVPNSPQQNKKIVKRTPVAAT